MTEHHCRLGNRPFLLTYVFVNVLRRLMSNWAYVFNVLKPILFQKKTHNQNEIRIRHFRHMPSSISDCY